MLKVDLFLGVVTLVLWIFCVLDVILSRDSDVRNLPKLGWLILVLLFPLVGSIAWLVAGRPKAAPPQAYERPMPDFPEYDRPGRSAAVDPEKDAEFLRQVRERAEAQRKAYEEKKRREREAEGES